MNYYRPHPADPTLLQATLIDATLLALLFWAVWIWVERHPARWKTKLAQCGFLLICIYPVESVRLYWNEQNGRTDLGYTIAFLGLEGLLAAGVVLALFGNALIARAARRVVLVSILISPALTIDFAFDGLTAENADAYRPKPSLPMLAARPSSRAGPAPRVVMIVFDEFDQRLAFDLRRPKVDLPELDRLRAESLVTTEARQTAVYTALALPSLISGIIYRDDTLRGANELWVYPPDAPAGMNWRDAPNVFKKARAMGLNAALVGWHHPYCRIFGDQMVRCLDVPMRTTTQALIHETGAEEEGAFKTVLFLFRLQLASLADIFDPRTVPRAETISDEYVQRHQQGDYFEIRDRAYADAVDPRIDFLFAHFPVPHPFGIYNRKSADFTLNSSLGYADNLALVDRTVGEMRRALEKAGLWDSTSLLITSDHGLRPWLWSGHLGWTPELDQLTGGKQSPTVPVILKLAGESQGAVYTKPFSNVICGDLSLAIVDGTVSTEAGAAQWINQHAPLYEKSVR